MTEWPRYEVSESNFRSWQLRAMQQIENRRRHWSGEVSKKGRELRLQLGATIAQVNHQGVWLND